MTKMATSEITRKSTNISLSVLHLEDVYSCAATFCYLSMRKLVTGALLISAILTRRRMLDLVLQR